MYMCPRRRSGGWREPDRLAVHASSPFKFLAVQRGMLTSAQRSARLFGTASSVQRVEVSCSGMQQLVFQPEEWSLPMQWDQVVEPTGHPRRAKACLRRDLGDLGSALSAHGQPRENQSSSSLELECSLGLQYCAPGQSSCSLIYIYIIVYVTAVKLVNVPLLRSNKAEDMWGGGEEVTTTPNRGPTSLPRLQRPPPGPAA